MSHLEQYKVEDGKEVLNDKYISDEELREMYIELRHFQAFTTLPDVIKNLKNSKNKQSDKILEEMTNGTAQIGRTIVNLEQVMLDRMDEKAKKRGIKNFKYNRAGSVMNKFLSAGSVSDPYSRYIHEVNQEMKGSMIKYEKRLAQEISEKDAILKEYAEAQGLTLQEGYEMLINPNNKNLYAKYSPKYYESSKTALEKNDLVWMKKYHNINDEYYNKEFKNMQARAYQRIQKDLLI